MVIFSRYEYCRYICLVNCVCCNSLSIVADSKKLRNMLRRNLYEKVFFILVVSLFLLSGCSSNEPDNPYEIMKDTSTLSYYDKRDDIDIEGFNVLEHTIQNIFDKDNNIIVNDDGIIRCITIIDDTVKTFKSISVGDKIDKVEEAFDYGHKDGEAYYSVLFNGNTEEDPTSQRKEDTWLWIHYYIDDSKIELIRIYDVRFGRDLK